MLGCSRIRYTMHYFRLFSSQKASSYQARAKLGDRKKFEKALAKVADTEPEDYDRP